MRETVPSSPNISQGDSYKGVFDVLASFNQRDTRSIHNSLHCFSLALGFFASPKDCGDITRVLSGNTKWKSKFPVVNLAVVFLLDRNRIPLVSSGHGLLAIVKLLAWFDRFDSVYSLGRHEARIRVLARLESHDRSTLDLGSVGRHNDSSGIDGSEYLPMESRTPILKCSMAGSGS
jgi:hypothetical protein